MCAHATPRWGLRLRGVGREARRLLRKGLELEAVLVRQQPREDAQLLQALQVLGCHGFDAFRDSFGWINGLHSWLSRWGFVQIVYWISSW